MQLKLHVKMMISKILHNLAFTPIAAPAVFARFSIILVAIAIVIITGMTVSVSAYSYPMLGVDEPWDHSPIRIYIDDNNVPQHYDPVYKDSVLKAIEYWKEGGNGKLVYTPEFMPVDSATGADIIVIFVENLETVDNAPEGVAGFARPYMQDNRDGDANMLEKVEIVLELGNYQGRAWRPYGKNNMFQISKHELGHALGLAHSSNPRDIMYFSYAHKEDINPELASMTRPYLPYAIGAVMILFSYIGIGYYRNRQHRKLLEDELFSSDAKL